MSEKIDINLANAETLATIPGIGPALAARIIEYRETVHPFEEVIELAAVPGISEKMVRGFEQFVTVQSGLEETAAAANLDLAEETSLLDAPEPLALLDAPEQPEALLVAELPDDEVVAEEEEMTPNDSTPLMPEPTQRTPDPTPPPQPPADWEGKVQRRGCLNTLLGATFGAILGAMLTLAILASLNNGSINYASSNAQIRQQLNMETISRTNELNQLSTRVSLVATEEAAANRALQTDLAAANEAINEQLANNGEIISYLATRSGDFELRLQDVAGAADTFIGFLDGLRFLLDDLDGATATPSASPRVTATPSAADVTVSPTPTPTPLSETTPLPTPTAVQPTRTPQPTATPFTFPTNTPAPQP